MEDEIQNYLLILLFRGPPFSKIVLSKIALLNKDGIQKCSRSSHVYMDSGHPN